MSRGYRKCVSGVISLIFLALVLIVVIGLVVYFFNTSLYMSRLSQEIASRKAESLVLARSLNGVWEYNPDSRTIELNVTNNYSHPIVITRVVIIYPDHTYQLTGIHGVFLDVGEEKTFTIPVKEKPATVMIGGASTTGVGASINSLEYTPAPPPSNVTYANVTNYKVVYAPVVFNNYTVAVMGYNSSETAPKTPTGYRVLTGNVISGSLSSLESIDGNTLIINSTYTVTYRFPEFAAWRYYKPITIHENTGSDLTNYTVEIVLNDTNFNFNHANPNGTDIRFLGPDKKTLLDYWIQEWNPSSGKAIIWVKIPLLPGGKNTTIYMLYGNPSATSYDEQHYGLTKVMVKLPANDGSNYRIYYQEWKMPVNLFSKQGTPMNWHADDDVWTYNLSFSFPFYSGRYSRIYVCSNGFISFYNYGSNYSSTDWELEHGKMIAPFWADLETSGSYDIYINASYSDEYGSGVYIRWYTTFYPGIGSQNFALVLYSNGLIRMDYGTINGYSWTDDTQVIGVSWGDGVHYTISSYDYSRLHMYPSNYDSLMYWPRKKATVEPTVYVGGEEENAVEAYATSLELWWSNATPMLAAAIHVSASTSTSSYTFTVEDNSSSIWRVVYSSNNNIPTEILVNEYFSTGSIGFRLNITSENPFNVSVDYTAITGRLLDMNKPLLMVLCNESRYIYVYNVARGEWFSIELNNTLYNPSVCFDYSNMSFFISNGTSIWRYDPFTNSLTYCFNLPIEAGQDSFLLSVYNGSDWLVYAPGGGSREVYVYNTSGSQAYTGSLPEAVEPYTCVASRLGSEGYVLFGGTGDLYLVTLDASGTPSFRKLELTPSTPTAYPVGLAYGDGYLWVIEKGGAIHKIYVDTGAVSAVKVQPPYYPIGDGDRLGYYNGNLYHVREDGSSEIWIISVS